MNVKNFILSIIVILVVIMFLASCKDYKTGRGAYHSPSEAPSQVTKNTPQDTQPQPIFSASPTERGATKSGTVTGSKWGTGPTAKFWAMINLVNNFRKIKEEFKCPPNYVQAGDREDAECKVVLLWTECKAKYLLYCEKS